MFHEPFTFFFFFFYWRINTVRVDCQSTQAEEMPGCCKIWLTRKNDRPWPRPTLWFSWTDPPQVLTNRLSRVRSCVTSEGRWCWKECRKKDVSSAAFQGIYLCVWTFWTVFKDRGNKTRRKTEVHPNSWQLCWQFMYICLIQKSALPTNHTNSSRVI